MDIFKNHVHQMDIFINHVLQMGHFHKPCTSDGYFFINHVLQMVWGNGL